VQGFHDARKFLRFQIGGRANTEKADASRGPSGRAKLNPWPRFSPQLCKSGFGGFRPSGTELGGCGIACIARDVLKGIFEQMGCIGPVSRVFRPVS
jgi:hypothetical protein